MKELIDYGKMNHGGIVNAPIDEFETIRGILTDTIIAPFWRGSIFEGNLGTFIRDTYGDRFDEAADQIKDYANARVEAALREIEESARQPVQGRYAGDPANMPKSVTVLEKIAEIRKELDGANQ